MGQISLISPRQPVMLVVISLNKRHPTEPLGLVQLDGGIAIKPPSQRVRVSVIERVFEKEVVGTPAGTVQRCDGSRRALCSSAARKRSMFQMASIV
jgi:hypothetical protein